MCRNIRTLYNFDPPASEGEIRAAALQYVRKISGFTKPSQANAAAFEDAVDEITRISAELLASLKTTALPRDREIVAYDSDPDELVSSRVAIVLSSGYQAQAAGERLEAQAYQVFLPKPYSFKASPVGANGRMYLATEDEDVVVVRLGERLEVLATNTLQGQSFIASPVIVDGDLYLRSQTHLFRVSDR